jgi:hypothetical protein
MSHGRWLRIIPLDFALEGVSEERVGKVLRAGWGDNLKGLVSDVVVDLRRGQVGVGISPVPEWGTEISSSLAPGVNVGLILLGNFHRSRLEGLLEQGNIRTVPGGESRNAVCAVANLVLLTTILPQEISRPAVDGSDGKERERLVVVLLLQQNQSLDVESPLLLIFDEVGDVETGRNRVAGWKGIAGTVDSNARHDIEGRSE